MASGRVPYNQWLASLSKEQLAEHYRNKLRKSTDPRAKRGRVRSSRTTSVRRAAPRRTYVRGRGEYETVVTKTKRVPSSHGSVPNKRQNRNFSDSYGSRLGAVVGEGLQSFANALGFGEYNIQQNTCMSMIDMGSSPPRVKNTNRGEAMIINHREYIGELTTGTGTPSVFTIQSYPINIGNSVLFPFGSEIAKNFQEWEVRGMLVELKSEASNTATALSLGSMFCAVNYNVLDVSPSSKMELENMEYACSNKPTDSIIMPIECARKNDVLTHMYIAIDEDYQSGDKRFCDLGKLHIGTYGCPTPSTPIAEIWVTYEIALYKPKVHHESIPTLTPHYAAHCVGTLTSTADPPLKSAMIAMNSDIPVYTSDIGTTSTVIIDTIEAVDYNYLLHVAWRNVSTFTPSPPGITFAEGSSFVTNFFSGISGWNQQTQSYSTTSSPQNQFITAMVVNVKAGYKGRINFNGGVVRSATHNSYFDLVVTRMPSDLINAAQITDAEECSSSSSGDDEASAIAEDKDEYLRRQYQEFIAKCKKAQDPTVSDITKQFSKM